jgi:deoxyadenosine/deoxycytidine kinase
MRSAVLCRGVQVVKEPVDDWQRVPAQHMGRPLNMLDTFYQDPQAHATSFQSLVLFSRVMQVRQGTHMSTHLGTLADARTQACIHAAWGTTYAGVHTGRVTCTQQ